MKATLDAHKVRVVAISTDAPELVRVHETSDQLNLQLLSDDLTALETFGLVHRKGVRFATWYVLGIPLGYPVDVRKMAIPTSLLIDEHRVIRWMDQATDYRLRGDEARIADALNQAFGTPQESS